MIVEAKEGRPEGGQVRRITSLGTLARSVPKNAILCLVLGILGALFLVGPLTEARFSPIDGHQPLELLGPDYRLPLSEVPAAIMSTEVGKPGVALRYRPFYYTVRTLESSIFTDNVRAYYIVRIALFAVMLTGLLWVAISALGRVLGVALIALTMDFPFWGGIWARLGPGEQYASIGLCLFLFGFVRMFRDVWRKQARTWDVEMAFMCVGLIVAAGSKENCIFLSVPLALCGLYGWRTKQLSKWAMIFAVCSIGYAAAIATSVLLGVLATSSDIHGHSAGSRFEAFSVFVVQFLDPHRSTYPYNRIAYLNLILRIALVTELIAVPVFALIWRFFPDRRQFLRLLAFVGAINAFALIWVAWEILFYSGEWPTGTRYDFPGMLTVPLIFGSVLVLLRECVGKGARAPITAAVLIVGASLRFSAATPLFPIRDAVEANVKRTRQFEGDLTAAARLAQTHPDWPIFVEAGYPADSEPVGTLSTWLHWRHISNRLYLRVQNAEPDAQYTDFQLLLLDRMRKWSAKGDRGYLPLEQAETAHEGQGECFSMGYTGPAAPECTPMLLRR